MPELPEVEVTRRSFADAILGAEIVSVRLGQPLRWPLGAEPEVLRGQRVLAVRRRGKYLLLDLSAGLLMLHLGMSGSLTFRSASSPHPEPGRHDHFDLLTSRGLLRLHDPRRFGAAMLVDGESDPRARKLLGRLGVEPLDGSFEVDRFVREMRQRSSAVKAVLLGGEVVVGVGNIYASEALFLAGIRPTCRTSRLSRPRLVRLHQAIVEVLGRAVRLGGSTLRNFSNAQGESGHFQQQTMVYGRAGEPCRQCGSVVKTIRQGQRSTFFCPACQKL